MRYLILAILIVFSLLSIIKTETRSGDDLLNNFPLIGNYSDGMRKFVVGQSLQQRDERIQADLLAAGNQRSEETSKGNPYPYGWCTWYVAEKKGISASYGDAKNWPVNSETPQAGAVVATYESPRGHLAYVEAVEDDKIVVSEMNYSRWGKVSYREINKNAEFIRGYLI